MTPVVPTPPPTPVEGPSGVTVRFYFDDADPTAECECGWHTHGDAAVDAFRAWWSHLQDRTEHVQAML